MRTVVVPLKRVDTVKLKAELIAAGVPEWPGTLTEPTYASPALLEASRGMSSPIMSIDVPDGSDPATVREVVSQHIDERTDGQRKADKARRLITENNTPESIRLRAVIRVLYGSLVETRAWCNQLRQQLQAAGMPTPPRLQNRTWEDAMEAVLDQIDAEIPDEETNEMEVPK